MTTSEALYAIAFLVILAAIFAVGIYSCRLTVRYFQIRAWRLWLGWVAGIHVGVFFGFFSLICAVLFFPPKQTLEGGFFATGLLFIALWNLRCVVLKTQTSAAQEYSKKLSKMQGGGNVPQSEEKQHAKNTVDAYGRAVTIVGTVMKKTSADNDSFAAPVESKKKNSAAQRLARVEFDYVDADGNFSSRRVNVFGVDKYRFEGYCHTARNLRTFLIERVQGEVMDVSTGELLPAAKWAATLLVETGGGEFKTASPLFKKTAAHYERKEAVHFTGFSSSIRDALEELAEENNFYVAQSVVKDLCYLVIGGRASAKKISAAKAIDAEVIDKDDFLIMIGEDADYFS